MHSGAGTAQPRGGSATCPGQAEHRRALGTPSGTSPTPGSTSSPAPGCGASRHRTALRTVQPRSRPPEPGAHGGGRHRSRGAAAPGAAAPPGPPGSGAAPPRYAEPSGGRRCCHSHSPPPWLDRGFRVFAAASKRGPSAQLSPRRARLPAGPGCAARRSPLWHPRTLGKANTQKAPETRPNRHFSSVLPARFPETPHRPLRAERSLRRPGGVRSALPTGGAPPVAGTSPAGRRREEGAPHPPATPTPPHLCWAGSGTAPSVPARAGAGARRDHSPRARRRRRPPQAAAAARGTPPPSPPLCALIGPAAVTSRLPPRPACRPRPGASLPGGGGSAEVRGWAALGRSELLGHCGRGRERATLPAAPAPGCTELKAQGCQSLPRPCQ